MILTLYHFFAVLVKCAEFRRIRRLFCVWAWDMPNVRDIVRKRQIFGVLTFGKVEIYTSDVKRLLSVLKQASTEMKYLPAEAQVPFPQSNPVREKILQLDGDCFNSPRQDETVR